MLKKIFRLIRNLFIGLIWIFLYVTIINSELITLWNFNLLSVHSWNTIGYFWDAGGVIKSTKDFLFLFNLALVPILWFWGWRILARQDYISLLLLPYTIYNNYMIKKCGNPSAVSLKNLGVSGNEIEKIKEEIESIKPEKAQEVNEIRREILNKINSATEKS